jgi:uncharacterized protein involved in exopolysaccharide biosynthesis
LEQVRLIREAKIQETIFTLLRQQLERARIAKAKEIPSARILDRAAVPEWKSHPKVGLNLGVAGVLSLCWDSYCFLPGVPGEDSKAGRPEG